MRRILKRFDGRFVLPCIIFFTSILVTLVFWTFLPEGYRKNENSDYIHFYEPVAQRILNGDGITLPDNRPALRYPPGYSLVLAGAFWLTNPITGSADVSLPILTLTCFGFSSVFIYLISSEVSGKKAGLIAAFLWMTYPFALWLTKQPNSEIPFLVFFYASIYILLVTIERESIDWIPLLFSGILIGFATLIRPAALGVGIIFILFMFSIKERSMRSRAFSSAVILLGYMIIILPWEAWIFTKLDRVILLSTGGPPSIWDGMTFAIDDEGGYRQLVQVPSDVEDLMNSILRQARTEGAGNLAGAFEILIRETRQRPMAMSKLLGIKAIRSWFATDSGRLEWLILLFQLIYLPFVIYGGITLLQQKGIKARYMLFVLSLTVYFWLMTTGVLSILRYMVPVIGLLLIFIPPGLFKIAALKTLFAPGKQQNAVN